MIQGHAYEFDNMRKLGGNSAVSKKFTQKIKNIYII